MSGGAATVRTIGRYALYEAIASGGMATVFLGRLLGPVGFARTVAIKRLHPYFATDPEFVSMFLDEARLAARIRHPNVVPTLDVVATTGELFLVMEYVHGESLAKFLRVAGEEQKPIPVPIVVAILSGTLQGLAAAHEAKSERGAPLELIHRDVSPQNILLGHDGQARIFDFGVARAVVRLHTTQDGQVKGKIPYMAPEQLCGEPIGPATDLYAASVVLWEALAGRRLFKATGDGSLVVQVLEGNVTPPSQALLAAGDAARAQAVAPLDDVVMRGLSRAIGDRWQTARELARALETAVAPATAAQVSDWVETAVGSALRERAAIVAAIENSSAVEPTVGDLGLAMAASEPKLRNDWRTATAPTVRKPDVAPGAPEHEHEAAPSTQVISHAPVEPASTGAAVAHPAAAGSAHERFHIGPNEETLISVLSPVAERDAREVAVAVAPPVHMQTLQSTVSPLYVKGGAPGPTQVTVVDVPSAPATEPESGPPFAAARRSGVARAVTLSLVFAVVAVVAGVAVTLFLRGATSP